MSDPARVPPATVSAALPPIVRPVAVVVHVKAGLARGAYEVVTNDCVATALPPIVRLVAVAAGNATLPVKAGLARGAYEVVRNDCVATALPPIVRLVAVAVPVKAGLAFGA